MQELYKKSQYLNVRQAIKVGKVSGEGSWSVNANTAETSARTQEYLLLVLKEGAQ